MPWKINRLRVSPDGPEKSTKEEFLMLKSVEGIYRDGKIELLELPLDIKETRVIVTFLPPDKEPAQPPRLTHEELADLRWRFAAWEEDWNAPGMEAYDDM
jgi:hypothetical protein